MKSACSRIWLFLAAFAAAVPAYASGADVPTLLRTQSGHLGGWVSSDLDGDRQADLASAGKSRRDGRAYVQEITLRFSAAEASTVTVRSPLKIERLTVRDLDGDAHRDLILESFNRVPVAVLLNDGDGHFHQGDLDDFRFQLSHRSPRSFVAQQPDSPGLETGECPNDEPESARFSLFWPDLAGSRMAAPRRLPRPDFQHCSASSRGPPASC
jgi:hypothetical protein